MLELSISNVILGENPMSSEILKKFIIKCDEREDCYYHSVVTIGDSKIDVIFNDFFYNDSNSDVTNKPSHNHMLHEIYYINSGFLSIETNQKVYTIQEGDLCIIPSYSYHKIIETSPNLSRSTIRFWLSQNPDHKQLSQPCQDIIRRISQETLYYMPDNEIIQNLMENVRKAFLACTCSEKLNIFSKICFHNWLSLLFSNLFQALLREELEQGDNLSFHAINVFDKTTSSSCSLSIMVDSFFDNNYSKDISLTSLAEYLKYSPSQVNQLLNKMYGLSFKQKLIEIRMEKAKHLLEFSAYSISVISELVGYKSLKGFENSFVKQTGITPRKFRENKCVSQ